MAAKAIGHTTQKLNDMLKNGEIMADDLIPKLTDVMDNKFSSAAELAGSTAQASFNRFNNEVLLLQRTLSSSGIVDSLKLAADASTEFLRSLDKENVKTTVVVSITTIVDAVTILKRNFDITWKSMELGLLTINSAAWSLADAFINGPIENAKKLIELVNLIPSVPKIELPESVTDFSKSVSDNLDLSQKKVEKLAIEVNKLILSPRIVTGKQIGRAHV